MRNPNKEHRLEHRTKHIALRYFLARELQQRGQLRLAYVASQANTADVFTKALQPCDHQPCFAFLDWSCDLLFSPTLPMGFNYSFLSLFSHRVEHRTKHIALRYFLTRELQQRGQLRLAYVASQANTTDVFSQALQPCDHQRFCTVLGLLFFAFLDWSCDILFSPTLPMEVIEADKYAIMRRCSIPARDLRILDPLLSYPSTLLGREQAIVVNLEHIK
ncbi:unnamed protein product, partial [Closterium sp. NIES-53]